MTTEDDTADGGRGGAPRGTRGATVGLCLGPYGGPGVCAVSSERGTSVAPGGARGRGGGRGVGVHLKEPYKLFFIAGPIKAARSLLLK